MTHRRYLKLLERLNRSGLTISAFCRRQKIPLGTFYSWRRRFQTLGDCQKAVPEFFELKAPTAPEGMGEVSPWPLIVLRAGRLTLELPQDIPAPALTGMISALQQAGLC